jgi:hypothetical protein
MSLQILNTEGIKRYNFENKIAHVMKVYNRHDLNSLSKAESFEIRDKRRVVNMGNLQWVGSEGYFQHWNKIEDRVNSIRAKFNSPDELKRNIAHMPSDATDFFDLIRLDISRRILEKPDVVPFICNVVSNDSFSDPTGVQWLLDYVAPFLEFKGNGAPVNLAQIKTGIKDSVSFTLWGVGFESDLYNELFNDIFSMQKLNEAVARGYVLRKNDTVLSPIFNFNFPDNKTITASTAGSLDQNYYDTFQNAITVLGQLFNWITKQEIDVTSNLMVICHSTRVRGINRAINGNLRNGDEIRNLDAISEIGRLLPYNTRTEKYGDETITYQGCSRDVAYLLLPKEAYWYLEKRGLTHKTGPGDVFSLSSDREAWYFDDSIYNDLFLGGDAESSETASDTAVSQLDGYVVKVNLPDDDEANT